MVVFLTNLAKHLISIGDIPDSMVELLRKIDKNPEYIPAKTSELIRLDTAFEREYVLEVSPSILCYQVKP